jgi:hypothetical protein
VAEFQRYYRAMAIVSLLHSRTRREGHAVDGPRPAGLNSGGQPRPTGRMPCSSRLAPRSGSGKRGGLLVLRRRVVQSLPLVVSVGGIVSVFRGEASVL